MALANCAFTLEWQKNWSVGTHAIKRKQSNVNQQITEHISPFMQYKYII